MNPVVSILINNYNYGRYLRDAIDSALAQTYPATEVVVVDDGSTDDSAEIIRSYGDKIRAVFKTNGGQASAFNAGFARSSGQIIALMDADDYFRPEAAEKIVSLWKEDTKILHHPLRKIDNSGKDAGALCGPLDSGNLVPLMLEKGIYESPPTTGLVYSRDLLQQLLPMPEEPFRICADTYLVVAAPFFSPVVVADETLAFYRLHGSNNWSAQSRRFMSRRAMDRRYKYYRIYRELLTQMAASRGLTVAPDWDRHLGADQKFERLLFSRTGSGEINPGNRFARMATTIKAAWTEPHLALKFRIKITILSGIVCLAPRSVLALIYPNLFNEAS